MSVLDNVDDGRMSPIEELVASEEGGDDRVEVAAELLRLLCTFVFDGRDSSAWPRRLWAVRFVLHPQLLEEAEQSVKGAAKVYEVSERGLYFLQAEAVEFFKASLCPKNGLCRFRSAGRFHAREGENKINAQGG